LEDREWMGVLRLLPGGSIPSFHDISDANAALVQMRTGVTVTMAPRQPRERADSSWLVES
ncbi:MAG: hypothetical protein IVW57_17140, partial [Ktedonobacterales bacterium]|nr:hypothetical protein [Ktedonobacterales bacterium]